MDDILITDDDAKGIGELMFYLRHGFQMKHLGQLRYFLGMRW